MIDAAAGPSVGLGEYGDLLLAFALSSLIGLEREIRQRNAGLRTHTLVGLGAALMVLVSKYGFSDVLFPANVRLDPSRIAAGIVTGVGFIGGGLIFVRRDAVRGLTTAATIWVVAGVGMACGAGLPLIAVAATGGHFIVVSAYPALARALRQARHVPSQLRVDYLLGEGVLRHVLVEITERGFTVTEVSTEHLEAATGVRARDAGRGSERQHREPEPERTRVVRVLLTVSGKRSVTDLAAALSEVDGVVGVSAGEFEDDE